MQMLKLSEHQKMLEFSMTESIKKHVIPNLVSESTIKNTDAETSSA